MLNGELFALHLATESKIIFENNNIASNLFHLFQFKSSYIPIINEANLLAWTIIKYYSEIHKPDLCNKRLVWCIRTICAANAASQKKNCFAAADIIKSVSVSDMDWVLAQKNNHEYSQRLITKMIEFLHHHGLDQPEGVGRTKDIDDCLHLFGIGSMGYKFLRSLKVKNSLGY